MVLYIRARWEWHWDPKIQNWVRPIWILMWNLILNLVCFEHICPNCKIYLSKSCFVYQRKESFSQIKVMKVAKFSWMYSTITRSNYSYYNYVTHKCNCITQFCMYHTIHPKATFLALVVIIIGTDRYIQENLIQLCVRTIPNQNSCW